MNASVQSCPLHVICPIVFIPGIMGSRLRNATSKAVMWDPGIDTWEQAWGTLGLAAARAELKKQWLVGGRNRSFSSSYLEVAHTAEGWQADRGYNGLLGTYLPFVRWLNRDEVTRIDGCSVMIRFMVWAYPYNWTDSNLVSARGVAEVVAEAEARATEAAERLGRQVVKPIIVTHSMGGLVSRAYTQRLGGAGSVLGVLHGAMPTHGSPELYKRIRGGFEGPTRFILGRDQEEVTATAANMPGPLELAPNRVYQDVAGSRTWLRARDGVGTVLWELPNSDPYSEIYANPTAWYRLVERSMLDPGGNEARAWSACLQQIGKARGFHIPLEGNGYHANTRMFYGTERMTRDHVSWRPLEGFAGGYPVDPVVSSRSGRVVLRGTHPDFPDSPPSFSRTLDMDGPNAQGDGTVQAGSGIHVNQMSVPIRDGFEHQGAYDSLEARDLTRDWLVEMVAEAVA